MVRELKGLSDTLVINQPPLSSFFDQGSRAALRSTTSEPSGKSKISESWQRDLLKGRSGRPDRGPVGFYPQKPGAELRLDVAFLLTSFLERGQAILHVGRRPVVVSSAAVHHSESGVENRSGTHGQQRAKEERANNARTKAGLIKEEDQSPTFALDLRHKNDNSPRSYPNAATNSHNFHTRMSQGAKPSGSSTLSLLLTTTLSKVYLITYSVQDALTWLKWRCARPLSTKCGR